MEVLFELGLLLIVYWRMGLGLLAGCLAAALLAMLSGGGLDAAAAIVTIVLGLGAGMLWQIGHERSKQAQPPPGQR